MARILYSIIFAILTPFIVLRLFIRSRKAPDYRKRIFERFAFYQKTFKPNGICLHAVSVGELMAARPLIVKLQQVYPDLPFTITTTTPTASKQVRPIFGDTVQHVYLPYDLNSAVKRFLNAFKPRIFIIMETEIWPNLFYHLSSQKIPFVIANARLAEKSMQGYKKLTWLFTPVLQSVNCIATQSKIDAEHFKQLGVTDKQLFVMGNLKYDVALPQNLVEKALNTRARFTQQKVWIASSTHAAEEDLILETAQKIKQQLPHTLCIIAPRHPERFNDLAASCIAKGFQIARHSLKQTVEPDTDILLADTLGELFYFYALADIAVVCGSFAKIGGHNILEPAILGLPIIVGPQMYHFKSIMMDFLQGNAILQIDDGEKLAPALFDLFNNSESAKQMGERAKTIVAHNQGAVLNILNVLQPFIDLN